MPTFRHGSGASFKLHDGTSLRDLSTILTNVGLDQSKDTAETSAFGSTAKSYIGGLRDGSFSIEGTRDQTLTGYVKTAMAQTASVAFEYYPEGTTAGRPKFTGNCIVTGFSDSVGVDDAAKWSADLQVDGAITDTTA